MWLVYFLAGWLVIAIVAGILIGRAIHWADNPPPTPPKRRSF